MVHVRSRHRHRRRRSKNFKCLIKKMCSMVSSHAAAGSNPKHTVYAFFNLYYRNCNVKRTKINKKRPDWPMFCEDALKHENLVSVVFHREKSSGTNPIKEPFQ